MKTFVLCVSFLLAFGASTVQAAQPQPANAAALEPNAVADWAARVISMIDRGEAAQLWDGASSVAKQRVKRDAFVAGVQAARKPLGAVAGREWASVRRQRHAEGREVPAGEYASVEVVALFANKQVKTELVTFRHDEDGTWRFAGYVVR